MYVNINTLISVGTTLAEIYTLNLCIRCGCCCWCYEYCIYILLHYFKVAEKWHKMHRKSNMDIETNTTHTIYLQKEEQKKIKRRKKEETIERSESWIRYSTTDWRCLHVSLFLFVLLCLLITEQRKKKLRNAEKSVCPTVTLSQRWLRQKSKKKLKIYYIQCTRCVDLAWFKALTRRKRGKKNDFFFFWFFSKKNSKWRKYQIEWINVNTCVYRLHINPYTLNVYMYA